MGEPLYLYFEDVAEGAAHSLEMPPITRTAIVRYAGASGDFNPVHHDELYAIRRGNDRVFAMGMLSAGYLSHLVGDWLGPGNLRNLSFQFRSQVWPGDVLTCKGVIKRKYEASGERRVDADLRVENQRGEAAIVGAVTAALPTRAR
ncbi:MAG: hypothetical protein EXR60_04725 [Dehalococcoidia bacterium]|nr:hypothetical protein [Dehalococcoidia bacterium]